MSTDRAPRAWLPLACLTALWALLFLPHLGTTELRVEEGRRFLPARAMFTSGDQVLPTIFERPYLAKPPLHYWAIELCSLPGGAVTRWSTRLPSALATLGVAVALFLLADRALSRRAATCAALTWFATPLAVEKGTLGELEAPLALFVTLALWGLFAARFASTAERRRSALWLGGAALGCAVLTKGPAAWVFVGAAALGSLALDRRSWRAILGPALAMVAISAAIAGVWVALLVQRLGWAELQATWSQQMVGGRRGLFALLESRATYVARAAGGLLPGALLAFALLPRFRRRAPGERGSAPAPLPPLVRFALATALGAAAFFLLYPRSEARYVLPAAPWVALIGGYVLARGIDCPGAGADGLRTSYGRAWRWSAFAVGAAGAVAGVACLVAGLANRGVAGLAPLRLDSLGVALALALAASGAAALAFSRAGRAAPALLAAFGVLAGVRGIHATQVIPRDALRASLSGNAPLAAEIDAALPPGKPLYTAWWGGFNALALLPRRVIFTAAPEELAPDSVLLFATRADTPAPTGVERWPRVGQWTLSGWTLVAVERP
jgi:4-amino-4-deoxy-L-arabinose transferase-like glycosyltransferase